MAAIEQFLKIACGAGGKDGLIAVNAHMPEARTTEVASGDWHRDDPPEQVSVQLPGAERCDGVLVSEAYSVAVEGVIGGLAPYPALVTADFARALRVKIPLPLKGLTEERSSCALTMEGEASVSIGLTAANFEALSKYTCICM